MTNFFIRQKFIDERLDKYLVARLRLSRNQVQKLIKQHQITVNDRLPSVHQFLRSGDKISINQPATAQTDNSVKTVPKIIKTTADYYIINKPAGLLVHPTAKGETDTLLDWLLAFDPKLKTVGDDPNRPALIHRLDKEVSGLMIIPRHLDAFDHFKKLFKTRAIHKTYVALVHGTIAAESGIINFPITRSKSGLYVASPQNSATGQSAETRFKVTKRFDHHTLLEINPKTGRTNQIRVHLNAIDHPIVGDPLYTNAKIKPQYNFNLDRVFLHAAELNFVDLNQQSVSVKSTLPKNLQTILESLD